MGELDNRRSSTVDATWPFLKHIRSLAVVIMEERLSEQAQQVYLALKEVKRSLKAVDTELKFVNDALTLDGQNASLLQKHTDLLQKRAELGEDEKRLLEMKLQIRHLVGDSSWPYSLHFQSPLVPVH